MTFNFLREKLVIDVLKDLWITIGSLVFLWIIFIFYWTPRPIKSPELRFNLSFFLLPPLYYFFLSFYLGFDVLSVPNFLSKLSQIILEGVTGAKSIKQLIH